MFGIEKKEDVKKAVEVVEKKRKLLEKRINQLQIKIKLIEEEQNKSSITIDIYENARYMLGILEDNIKQCDDLLTDLYNILKKKTR